MAVPKGPTPVKTRPGYWQIGCPRCGAKRTGKEGRLIFIRCRCEALLKVNCDGTVEIWEANKKEG